jgi:hypothetical protein
MEALSVMDIVSEQVQGMDPGYGKMGALWANHPSFHSWSQSLILYAIAELIAINRGSPSSSLHHTW